MTHFRRDAESGAKEAPEAWRRPGVGGRLWRLKVLARSFWRKLRSGRRPPSRGSLWEKRGGAGRPRKRWAAT